MSAYCMTGLLHELVYWTSGLMHTVETDTSVQPMLISTTLRQEPQGYRSSQH